MSPVDYDKLQHLSDESKQGAEIDGWVDGEDGPLETIRLITFVPMSHVSFSISDSVPRAKQTVTHSKDVRLPVQLQRAMAAEAEATREARAKVIAAEGEQRASRALRDAAHVISQSPSALQLRSV